MKSGELFAGYGGLALAIEEVFGAEPVWLSEWDENPSRILAHRFPGVPNYGDITAIDWERIEPVNVIGGGFPCQDLSLAGKRRGMRDGTRSGLWAHMFRGIEVIRPEWVVAENVRGLLSGEAHSDVEPCSWCMGDDSAEPDLRALGAVLADLDSIGYDTQWLGIRAADVGAPHHRFRVFVLGHRRGAEDSHGFGSEGRGDQSGVRGGEASDAPADWPALVLGRCSSEDLERLGAASHADSRDEGSRGPEGGLSRELERSDRNPAGGSGEVVADTGRILRRAFEGVLRVGRTPDLDSPDQGSAGGFQAPADYASGAGREPELEHLRSAGSVESGERGGPDWGPFEPSIRRWEGILGRPAPAPTLATRRDGGEQLNPAFTEWMMGLPAGWLTDPAIWEGMKPGKARDAQLKACGNGVVPQQAVVALTILKRVAEQ